MITTLLASIHDLENSGNRPKAKSGTQLVNKLMMIVALILFALVSSSVFLVLLLVHAFFPKEVFESRRRLDIGDMIVYRKQKVSMHPSPRAYDIHPAGQGDTYRYFVDKYWVVENVLRDGRVQAATRTHKRHYLRSNDPNLRKAGLIARLRHRHRFPELQAAA